MAERQTLTPSLNYQYNCSVLLSRMGRFSLLEMEAVVSWATALLPVNLYHERSRALKNRSHRLHAAGINLKASSHMSS